MKLTNHIERQRPVSAHNFVDSSSLANHANQRAQVLPGLIQSELNGLDRVGHIYGIVISLVGLNKSDDHVQLITLSGSLRRSPKLLYSMQRRLIVSFCSDGFNLHT